MRTSLFAIEVALLAGCASSILQSYVSRDVRDVMLDYGPPANAFDMGDGRRAFQWVKGSAYTTPTYATTNAVASGAGRNAWVTSNTQISGGQTITSRCVYTLFAEWNESRQGWKVVSFNKPATLCE